MCMSDGRRMYHSDLKEHKITVKVSEAELELVDTKAKDPALFKWKEGKLAERISEDACPHFEVVKNSVIYLNSTLVDYSHGQLYVARPDGMNERVMEEELYDFSVDDESIYFTYCFDTVGVGLEGHALYNLNYGSNYAIHANEEKIHGDTQDDTQGDTQDDTEEKIIKMIKDNPQVSTADMAKELKIGIATVKRKIKKMSNVSYVGSGYSGHWEING